MPDQLRISVFGGLRIESALSALEPPSSPRVRSLLAWLAMHPGMHPRGAVAARFWPDVLDENARTSLRSAVLALRRDLGSAGAHLVARREDIGLRDVTVDWVEFGRAVAEGDLERALELASGELMPDLDAEWVHEARAELVERLGEVLSRLARAAAEGGNREAAVGYARRAVALDPLAEAPARELIRLRIDAGDIAAATLDYDRLKTRLRSELGLAPSRETRDLLANALKDGDREPRGRSGPPEHLPLPPALALPERLPFVGREEATTLLCKLLEEARSERRLVLLTGEPGIGKTRLASELGRLGHAEGAHVLYGRCSEEPLVAYEPFVDALAHHIGNTPAEVVSDQAGDHAPQLTRLLPQLRDDAEDLPGDPGEGDRYHLFEAVMRLLGRIGLDRPVVLILDDLHWADSSTLVLLRHMFRPRAEQPLLVVGTYRESERATPESELGGSLDEVLADLSREHPYERLALTGLAESEASLLFDALSEGPLDPALRRSLLVRTEGNPFFLKEIVRHLGETGALESRTSDKLADPVERYAIPDEVKTMIMRRIDRLGEPARRVLSTGSVIGRDFDVEVLAAVEELSEDELLDRLDEAVSAQILGESRDAPGQYSFSHALVRETLYEDLTANRRALLHGRVATVLEDLHRADLDAHSRELARHFVQAGRADLDKAAAYSVRAAEHALSVLAYEEAAACYAQASGVLELTREPDDAARCELMLSRGDALTRAGETSAARETFIEAAEVARSLLDPERLARAAVGIGAVILEMPLGRSDDVLVSLLDEALDALPTADSPLRATVMARLARELYYTGHPSRVKALAQAAVEMARRTGDLVALGESLIVGYLVAVPDEPLERRLALCAELAGLETSGPDGEQVLWRALWGRIFRVGDLLELGDLRAADREIEAFSELAEELRMPYFDWFPAQWRAMRALLAGRLEAGKELAFDALSIGQETHGEPAMQVAGAQLQVVNAAAGRLDELQAAAEYWVQRNSLPLTRCALALLYAELGRQDDARREFDRLASDEFAVIRRDFVFLPAMTTLAETCYRLNERRRAPALYARLLPYADRYVVVGMASLFGGSVERSLALLAFIMSRLDDAEHHFERALARNESLGAHLYTILNQRDYARMLLSRRGAGDRERALELLGQALSLGKHLDVTYIRDWVRPVLSEHGITPKEMASSGVRLDRRSVDEVAAEVMEGARIAFTKRGRAALAKLVRGASDEQLERRFGSQRVQKIIFRSMTAAFDPKEAPGFSGEITYELVHEAAADLEPPIDYWTIAISGSDAAAREGLSRRPAVSIRLSISDFARLLAGEINPVAAMFENQIDVRGDMAVAARLDAMFRASGTR